MAREKGIRRFFKKQKYNIILLAILVILGILLIGFITDTVKNRNISKYDKEIVLVKDNGSEIDSISIKELRNSQTDKVRLDLSNQENKTSIEGVSLEKILNSFKLDPTNYTKLETKDSSGQRDDISIDKALEPDRVYLVYKINGKPTYDYDKDYGYFIIIDTQSKDSSEWSFDVKEINLK